MCLIIDNNVAPIIFRNPYADDYKPIFDWCEKKDGCIVHGGRLTTELIKCKNTKRFLISYERAGRARRIKDDLVNEKEINVNDNLELKSDDPHIIALALVSQVRLLCTNDKKLEKDFKNIDIISPRGNIYKNKKHKHLLKHSKTCLKNSLCSV